MKRIDIHITDLPVQIRSGETVENTHFRATGSTYGRFLFTTNVMVEVEPNAKNVIIRHCVFDGHWSDGATGLQSLKVKALWRYRQIMADAKRRCPRTSLYLS